MHSRNEGRGIWRDWAVSEVVVGQVRRDVHPNRPRRFADHDHAIVTTGTGRPCGAGRTLQGETRQKAIAPPIAIHKVVDDDHGAIDRQPRANLGRIRRHQATEVG